MTPEHPLMDGHPLKSPSPTEAEIALRARLRSCSDPVGVRPLTLGTNDRTVEFTPRDRQEATDRANRSASGLALDDVLLAVGLCLAGLAFVVTLAWVLG